MRTLHKILVLSIAQVVLHLMSSNVKNKLIDVKDLSEIERHKRLQKCMFSRNKLTPSISLSFFVCTAGVLLNSPPTASAATIDTLATFDYTDGRYINGDEPGDLVEDSQGNLFGTTSKGGINGCGTLFEYTPSSGLKSLASFDCSNGHGREPNSVIKDKQGNLFGTTAAGGVNGCGTVFEYTPGRGIKTLAIFNDSNGCRPNDGLVEDSQGNLFGTTFKGGVAYSGNMTGGGTVFEYTPGRGIKTLAFFNGSNGSGPSGGLVEDSQGNLFGTTFYGGANGHGTVFEYTPGRGIRTLASFNGTNGSAPIGVIEDKQGNLFGVTSAGGAYHFGGSGLGTIFKYTPGKGITTLVSFNGNGNGSTLNDLLNSTGGYPRAGLIEDSQGNLFGTTYEFGPRQGGTVFEYKPGSGLKILAYFHCPGRDASVTCPNQPVGIGAYPFARLVEDSQGNLFGTTIAGGPGDGGTIFKVSGVDTSSPTPTNNKTSSQEGSVVLTKATTTDAQSVTIDYTIEATNSSVLNQPIHFEVYRSPTDDTTVKKIGEQDISDQTLLGLGKHRVKLFPETILKPDTAFPYVVVVATYNSKKSTTYFRKWMLGAISHGFNRWNQSILYQGARVYELVTDDNLTGIPDWETNMAKSLKDYDGYDDVITFDWTKTCAIKQPGTAVKAGVELREKVLDWISVRSKQHPGDVVDIHLIGHSRGSVVVTQALNGIMPYLREFYPGSYVELTLLDPHPANNELENPWANFGTKPIKWLAKTGSSTLLITGVTGYNILRDYVYTFQKIVRDPFLEIPEDIKTVDVWYQHTRADDLEDQPDLERIMNLWGLHGVNVIRSKGSVPINFHDLTTGANFGKKAVGHNQVPSKYEDLVVKTGKLNRGTY